MPWHDEPPWVAKRKQQEAEKAAIAQRLDKIEQLVSQAKRGQISERKALDEIEDTARGGADAIVRVGSPHTPDIQTTREDR